MRIIAGEFKGKELLAPPASSTTRPITGAVKKSLFGMLGEDLAAQVVADLYCGTGTLGIEALSRGARLCCFADMDRQVLRRLERNLQDVRAQDRAIVWQGDVEQNLGRWLSALDSPLDVAFVDPPYELTQKWDWAKAAERVFSPLAAHLAADGLVVLRTSNRAELPRALGPLAIRRERRYGDMVLALLARADVERAP